MSKAASTKLVKEKGTCEVASRRRDAAPRTTGSGNHDQILNLQRTIGNRAIQDLLQLRVGNSQPQLYGNEGEKQDSRSNSKPSEPDDHAALLQRANTESGIPLDENVRAPLERNLGVKLSGVRVHSGVSSEAAAESLGAKAYTIGSDIHLGPAARHLNTAERRQLLAHEAVHAIQQGGRPVALQGKLEVSRPRDSAEIEADQIAKSVMSNTMAQTPSAALGRRDHLSTTPIPLQSVSRVAAPLIQRDIKDDFPVNEGNFRVDLTTESHPGAKSGMSGTIKYKANNTAPDSTSIRLLQVVRTENLTTGKDNVYGGGEANRNKMMTTEDRSRGIEPGFFVDHAAATATPRSKKTDPAVSPYYRDYWPNAAKSQDGSKKGNAVSEASLWDYPGSSGPKARFSFETVAKAADTGHVFGTVMWGFTISDVAKGTVEKERAVGRNVTLATTDKAIEKFNEFYRNPGASTAP
jgi:hypothetical protein